MEIRKGDLFTSVREMSVLQTITRRTVRLLQGVTNRTEKRKSLVVISNTVLRTRGCSTGPGPVSGA